MSLNCSDKTFQSDVESLMLSLVLSGIFIDCEKELYEKCWDIVSGKILKNGYVIADNAASHFNDIKPMIEKAMADERFDCLLVPIGTGELVCRRK